jgi:TRAP-type C4-dicarboxylate transport system substrate-binding protein
MGLKQIQVAAVTSVGLETITKDCAALSIPMLFQSNEELDYVRERMEPKLEKALEAKGFIVLNWGDGGWVRFFSVRPAKTIGEFKKLKLFTWAGSPQAEELYKDAGFRPVPLAPSDILQSLQTGIIEAFPAPPIAALAFQWFGLAKNMIDMKFAPIIGATIITKEAWEQIDPNLRPILMKEARAAGERLKKEIRQIDDQAILEMKKRNLVVYTPTPAEYQEWKQTVEKFYPRIRGEIVQPADFDEVKRLVDEYRARKKS